tara:strand:- start:4745 stop:4978 length:234 start_codon:yes stop_codon:yes gene_type:complete
MEYQNLINLFVGIAFTISGWFAREMWSAVKELKIDLAKLREELPKTYVTQVHNRDDICEIKEMLNKIFDKLDLKVDK